MKFRIRVRYKNDIPIWYIAEWKKGWWDSYYNHQGKWFSTKQEAQLTICKWRDNYNKTKFYPESEQIINS